jgi:hypothetical protein
MSIGIGRRQFMSALCCVVLIAAAWTVPGFAQDSLPSWNETAPKKAIVAFVERVTKQGSPDFVAVDERIATFDNDGTLWAEHTSYRLRPAPWKGLERALCKCSLRQTRRRTVRVSAMGQKRPHAAHKSMTFPYGQIQTWPTLWRVQSCIFINAGCSFKMGNNQTASSVHYDLPQSDQLVCASGFPSIAQRGLHGKSVQLSPAFRQSPLFLHRF